MQIVTISVEDLISIIDERLNYAIEDLKNSLGQKQMTLIPRLELAKKFDKSPETIDTWVKRGDLPLPVIMGAKKFFIWEEVIKYLHKNKEDKL